MNGRIYDPLLGRFLSADPYIDGQYSLQGYNRYSYVHNNPLTHKDETGHFISALITAGFAIKDTYDFASGKTSGAEYAANMALNGAALLADVATAGAGGGLAVRAGALAVRAAKVVDKADTLRGTVGAGLSVAKDVANGEVSRDTFINAASVAAGGKAGKGGSPNVNRIDAGGVKPKKVDTVDPKTAPSTETAKGGTYKLRDLETGDVKRTGRTNDHVRRESEHGKSGTDTEGLDYEVDTRTDNYAEQRGREQVIHDQHPEARHPNHVEGGSNGGLNKKRPIAPANKRRDEYLKAERERTGG